MNGDSNFKEKAKLIYEFDLNSPLFAVIAEEMISENNFEQAVETLQKGLELYPDYATAYLLLGKALLKLNKTDEAKSAFENAEKFFSSDYYGKLLAGEKSNEEKIDPILQEINDEILPEKPEPEIEEEEEEFASETLAAVYKAQGAFAEALKMYEKLLEKNPEKEEIYTQEIKELKEKINSEN